MEGTFLGDIVRQIQLNDLLDILLVSAVFFALLTWMRTSIPPSASRRVMVVIPAVVAVYVLARSLELYLLERLIQVLLVVFLIGLVVVFQSDIRRMLDRAGSWRSTRRDPYGPATVDVLAEVAAGMAETKTGALIAIRGREPWDGHIQGGVDLNGTMSQPLLYSIFHPETPGHDGAVLIEGDRIIKFAVHLPLSSDLPEVSRFGGTRHAAALGLSKECDAFIIVVSEESGRISVAHRGKLAEVESASALKAQVVQFCRDRYGPKPHPRRTWRNKRNVQSALISFSLAALLWFLLEHSPYTVFRSFAVPVEFRNLPEDWMLEGPIPTEAEVALIGTEQAFRRLDPEGLAVSIDLSDPRRGLEEIVISEEDINLPADLELERVDPRVLYVQLRRVVPVRVPVEVQISGVLPDTLVLVDLEVEPDSITLMLPEGTANRPRRISTEAVDLGQVTKTLELKKKLVLPPNARVPKDVATEVLVRVLVRPAEERRAEV